MAEEVVCWGCGKPEPPDQKFQTCARCREEGLTPSPFCSKECLKASWPKHKAWHKEKAGEVAEDDAAAKEKAVLSSLKNVLKNQPENASASYMSLVMQADELKLKGSYTPATKLLKEATALVPENPIAYAALGELEALGNKPAAAAALYVKAASLFPDKGTAAIPGSNAPATNAQGTNLWASSMLSAIFWLNVPGGKKEDQPSWFNDEELKALTLELCTMAGQDLRAWQTRAFVLCPMPDMPPQWQMPPEGMARTEEELKEAGRCWQRVMQMTPGGKEEKRPYVARAAHCFKCAQLVGERLAAQQAEAAQKAAEAAAAENLVMGSGSSQVAAW